jgi:hypothetical protein
MSNLNYKKIFTVLFLLVFSVCAFAQTPQYYNLNTGTSSNSFPFNTAGGKAINILFLAGDFANPTPLPAGQRITAVYFRTSTAGTRAYTNLHILLAQDSTLTALTSGTFYPGPYDTVFAKDTSLTSTVDGWMKVQLAHPFNYDPAKSLVLFVGHCGATGSGGSVRNSSLTPAVRRVWSVGGCPFAPYASVDGGTLNFGVDVEPVPPPAVFYYNFLNGTVNNSFPLNQAAGKMSQTVVPANTFINPTPAPVGNIVKLHFRIAATYPLGPATYSLFKIMLLHVPSEFVTAGSFITGAWDTVYQRDTVTLAAAVNTWLEFTLDHPFAYNPAQPLAISMEQCGATGTVSGFSLTYSTATGSRRVYSVGGCPYVYSGVSTNIINCGVSLTVVSGVTPITSKIPNEYKLEQNYPNPFNPVTKINFALPKAGFVSLRVYDMLGREVANLVNENRIAGSHTVDFDGSAFTSGAYFYRLESNGFADTKKMILIK